MDKSRSPSPLKEAVQSTISAMSLDHGRTSSTTDIQQKLKKMKLDEK